jgi:ABC-type sugar transport system permease subunit/ABC-type glycerol-3-phosphate transport system substrate-binding protein
MTRSPARISLRIAQRQNLYKRVLAHVLLGALFFLCPNSVVRGEAKENKPVTVTVGQGYTPNRPERPTTAALIDLMRRDSQIRIRPWGGIQLPGGGGWRTPFMMALAGETAPDIYYAWFHVIQNDIRQNFLYPLNEWVGEDLNGNGLIDDDEALWDEWKRVPDLWRRVATVDGKVYGIPVPTISYYGLIYRKDLVAQAGLNPEQPPETWDDFFYWCQKLTRPAEDGSRGQRAYAQFDFPWFWLPWVQAAGGSPVVQDRVSPTTGRVYSFPMEELNFITPDTGENLRDVASTWRANFDSPEAIAAAEWFHRLRWAPWIVDPVTGEPVNLTEKQVLAGRVEVDGRVIAVDEDNLIRGVTRPMIGQDRDVASMFARGEIALFQSDVGQLDEYGQNAGVPSDLIGMMPFPAMDKNHKRVFQGHRHYWGMTSLVGQRPKKERDKVWEAYKVLVSQEVGDREAYDMVLSGNAMFVRPETLRRLGLSEYLQDIPPTVLRFYDEVDAGQIWVRTEPFTGFWLSASDLLQNNVLSFILSTTGREFDYVRALKQTTIEANRGMMFEMPQEELDQYRPTARVLFGIALLVIFTCLFLIVREKYEAPAGSSGGKARPLLSAWMLAPALITIGVWSYYPLIRGAVMAFQEYRIAGESEWVGLNNIILVARDPNFYLYIQKTLKFVALTMTFGFLTPIVLALLLTEVPRGKIFFRTMFFLPQMTSGIVVALMWKMMYDPTPQGLLNQLLDGLGLPAQAWLQDPFWAMFCVILPGVWASAGMASLLYIAALHSFPEDLYESAALDGAGFLKRARHIALPQLMPLIIINFVGTFIASFQNMGHIFLLTFGGPGKETTVIGLAIWKLAYNDLRFSTATTMAWFLGVALIGFTYFQIRFLRKLEFRRAGDN